jgi:thiamine pyrophosphate-dependent acetolactate synthase large subunit-like protein
MLDDRERASDYVGMDFANRLDLAMMAQAMGVHGERVDDPTEIGPAINRAFESGKPALLDITISGAL